MSIARKKLFAGVVLLATAGLYLTVWTGCHSAPARPPESPHQQALRKAKRGD
ncbi:MAG TPA: hypothetical protein VFB38_13100 [Chthonomonadaceae bacterium]|nr:hypothetical protein [Chthonomonadaceae bacterium]